MLELGFWAEERGREGRRAEPIPQKKTEKGDARRKGMKGGRSEWLLLLLLLRPGKVKRGLPPSLFSPEFLMVGIGGGASNLCRLAGSFLPSSSL